MVFNFDNSQIIPRQVTLRSWLAEAVSFLHFMWNWNCSLNGSGNSLTRFIIFTLSFMIVIVVAECKRQLIWISALSIRCVHQHKKTVDFMAVIFMLNNCIRQLNYNKRAKSRQHNTTAAFDSPGEGGWRRTLSLQFVFKEGVCSLSSA